MNNPGLRVVHEAKIEMAAQPGCGLALVDERTEAGLIDEVLRPRLVGVERDNVLLEHLPTVRYIARKIHERLPQHVEMEDLMSAGIMGLIDAFNKFDHRRHVLFNSYAQFRIKGAIFDSLRVLDWGPRELRRKGRAIEEATRALTQQLGRAPNEAEIADRMEIKLAQYQQLIGELKGLEIGSLHVAHNENGGDDELAYVAGPEEDSPLFTVMQGEMRQRLVDTIEDLPEKERLVLTLYYYEELTMKEISQILGVVESRVSQIRSAAVVRLRTAMGVGMVPMMRKPPLRAVVPRRMTA